MQLSLLQEDLHQALALVSRFTATRAQLPVLGNVLFSAKDHVLTLSATNLEMAVSVTIGAKVESPGEITIPAKEVAEFVSYLSPGKVDLVSKGEGGVLVTSFKTESVFAAIPATDFPKLPEIQPDLLFSLKLDNLSEDIEQTAFAAAVDDTRPVLTGVRWEFTGEGYKLVATDGYRLSLKQRTFPESVKKDQLFLIPVRLLQELIRYTSTGKEASIGLTKDKHQVVFQLSGITFFSRLIEGDFPDYQRIVPGDPKLTVTVDKADFLQVVRQASVFARQSANVVRFKVDTDTLTLSANSPSVGENKTMLSARVEGEEKVFEIAFNYKFILDFLAICTADTLELRFTDSLAPGVFHDAKNPHFLHLIMPVRLQD